jgi:SAM-dependent methyltransferase
MKIDARKIRNTYQAMANAASSINAPDYFVEMTQAFDAQELWRDYVSIINAAPSFEGGVVVDIGCKYGHGLPMFEAMGAQRCIGVDVDEDYLRIGNAVFEAIDFPGRLVKSDEGYLPIEGESVDFVLVNEVISHVNPMYLDTLYSEIARILKVGGSILISDGNNRANSSCVADLHQLFLAWEMGPTGTNTGRDVVNKPFRERRRESIVGLHPELDADQLDYLAANTSGLFGDRLAIEVAKYLRKSGWVERPYRPGICPTNPSPSGVVMERALHPIQVELALAEVGIQAEQVYSLTLGSVGASLRNRIGRLARRIRLAWLRLFAPSALRGRTWAFQIVGYKVDTPPANWNK